MHFRRCLQSKEFHCKGERIKGESKEKENTVAKEAYKESLLGDIFQFHNISEQGAIPLQERLHFTKNTLKGTSR